MKHYPIIAASGFMVTTAIGWLLAGDAFNRNGHGAGPDEVIDGKLSRREPRSMSLYRTPDAVKEMMKAIRSAGTPEEQMRATMALAESIPASEIGKWMEGRWFGDCEGFNLTLLNRILTERWMKEDPEGFLAFSMKGEGTDRGLFDKWGKEEPQRVLQYFKDHPDGNAELRALGKMAGSHPSLVLGRLKEMMEQGTVDPSNAGGYYARQVMKELLKSNPAALDGVLDTLPPQWRNSVEVACISSRLESSFETEIQNLYAREDGWKMLLQARSDSNFGAKLLGELANMPDSWKRMMASNYYYFMNSSNAKQWLEADLEGNGFSASEVKNIRSNAIQNISYSKPELALEMISKMDLDEGSHRSLISRIFTQLRGQQEKAESLMAQLGSEEDRKFAEEALGTKDGDSSAAKAPSKIDKPADWLEAVSTLKPESGGFYQYANQLQNWDSTKMAELSRQFQTMSDDQKRNVAIMVTQSLSYNYSGNAFLGDAVKYLVSNPPEKTTDPFAPGDAVQAASNYSATWAQQDPVAASTWVGTLSSGEAKLWAQKNLANTWSKNDPDAANQWIATLPAKERKEVETFVKNGGKR